MKKIKILMLHLGFGGVEKQTITMANNLANYFDIEIVSFYKLNEAPVYEINEKIKIKYLLNIGPNREMFKTAIKNFKLFQAFKEGLKAVTILYKKKKLIKKEILLDDADVYFSTRTEYGIILSKYGNRNKLKLTQEHNFIDDNKYRKKIIKGYKNLNYVVVISKFHEKMYKEWLKNSNVKIKRIENILDKYPKKVSSLNYNTIIAAGRLNYIKDFLSLIEVMKYAVKQNPNLKLYLLGDGEEKNNILNKIKEYNLEKNVIMPGFVNSEEVQNYMLKSDIYIMTSIKECFPMVLLEANSCGLPIISFDVLSGPHEIVQNNLTGYLVQNRDCKVMAKKINELISSNELKKEFSNNAINYSKKFNANIIIKKWIKLLKEI